MTTFYHKRGSTIPHNSEKMSDSDHILRKGLKFASFDDFCAFADGPNWPKCQFCEKTFASVSNRQRHEKEMHNGERILCSHCSASFSREESRSRHYNSAHNSSTFECEACKQSFKNQRNLLHHKKAKHSFQPEFKCRLCEISYSEYNDLKRHRKTIQHTRKQKLRRFQCKTCNAQFTREDNLIRHVIASHETAEHEKFRCEFCPSTFSRVEDWERHSINFHTKDRSWVSCNICEKSYSRQDNLERHMKSVHRGDRFKCKECRANFVRKEDLVKHQKDGKHLWELYCTFCAQELIFKTEEKLKWHFSTFTWCSTNAEGHSNRKQLQLPNYCAKERAKVPWNYIDIMRKRECSIPECLKKFPSRIARNYHMKVTHNMKE